MPANRILSARVVCSLGCVALASCGGGGGGSGLGSGLIVSGTVLSPGGHALSLGISGLLPVPNGTGVELIRLDAFGNEVTTVAKTSTIAGRYSFNLTRLGLAPATDLAVAAGSGPTRMRALVTSSVIDVDPVSEATLQLMLEQNVGLVPFTLTEAGDLDAAIRLFALTQSLAAQDDVLSTIDGVKQAVFADASLANFLAATALDGQTSAGPGDIGDYFPSTVGDTWSFAGTDSTDGAPAVAFRNAQRIDSIDEQSVQSVGQTNPDDGGVAVSDYLEETDAALVNHGNDDPTDPITPKLVPYKETRFPLKRGEDRLLFQIPKEPLDVDLDFDGIDERFDATAHRNTVGFEDVVEPAGNFKNCVRFDTSLKSTIYLSSGPDAVLTLTESEWYAPHVGLVRTRSSSVASAPGATSRDDLTQELVAYQVGAAGFGILPPRDLAVDLVAAGSDESRPGKPAVGFDGTNYLLVTYRDGPSGALLIGKLLTATGVAIKEFTIFDVGGESRLNPSVAFDGTNYLIVFQPSIPGASSTEIKGVRVSTAGDVLDPTGFPVSSNGESNFFPSVAFDGANYLVVWRRFGTTLSGDIHATFVTPAGVPLGEFTVSSVDGDQISPRIVFGGGNYLVAWEEQPPFEASNVRAARVTPQGTVLDPDGIDVAVESKSEGEPAMSFDGTRYLVAWVEPDSLGLTGSIMAARLELDGTKADATPIAVCTTAVRNTNPTIAFDGVNHSIAWSVANFGAAGAIQVRRLTTNGELLDGPADESGIVVDLPGPNALLLFPTLLHGQANMLVAWLVNNELSGEVKVVDGALIYPY